MQTLLDRILVLPIPTLCVFNGHSVAGGLIFGLCHDFISMKDSEDPTIVCLGEINIGLSLPPGYTAIVKDALTPAVARKLVYGG